MSDNSQTKADCYIENLCYNKLEQSQSRSIYPSFCELIHFRLLPDWKRQLHLFLVQNHGFKFREPLSNINEACHLQQSPEATSSGAKSCQTLASPSELFTIVVAYVTVMDTPTLESSDAHSESLIEDIPPELKRF